MSNFHYKAKKKNEIISGNINADDASSAATKLERRGLIVLELSEESMDADYFFLQDAYTKDLLFSIKEKKEFFNSFYFQYKSGLSIHEVFRTISASSASKNVRELSLSVLRIIERGNSLEEALMPFSKALGKEYTLLVCSGEKSGKLNEVLKSIIQNIAREEDIKSNIISAITYPAFISTFAIIIFLFFRTFIFKVFDKMADGLSQEQIIMMLISSVIQIAVILIILTVGIIIAINNKTLKRKIIYFITKLPIISKLAKEYYFQNFFTILSLAYEAGIPIIDAVAMASGVIKTINIKSKIRKSVQMISQGCEVTTAFMVAGIFSKFAISQISAGEKSGELDKMFKTVAYDYEKKLETEIKVITKLMEPIIMIFIGIMVLYILYTGYNKYYSSLANMY